MRIPAPLTLRARPCSCGDPASHDVHRHNAIPKRVTKNKSRAKMTFSSLAAMIAWLERHRVSDHVSCLMVDRVIPGRSANQAIGSPQRDEQMQIRGAIQGECRAADAYTCPNEGLIGSDSLSEEARAAGRLAGETCQCNRSMRMTRRHQAYEALTRQFIDRQIVPGQFATQTELRR